MGAFRLLVCNIRNSCLPVCRLLPVHVVPIRTGGAHGASRKWYYFYVQAQEGEPRRTPSDSSNISRTKLYDGKKLTRQRGRKWTEISFEGINPFIKQPVLFISNIRFTVYFAVKDGCSEYDFEKEREN